MVKPTTHLCRDVVHINRLDLSCLLAYAMLNHSIFTLWVAVTHLTSESSLLRPRPATCTLHGQCNSDIMNITLCCNDAFKQHCRSWPAAAPSSACRFGCQLALSKRLEMRFQFPLDEASLIGWVYNFGRWAWLCSWDPIFFGLSRHCRH